MLASASAQFTWIGTASGNWDASSNWSGGAVPPALGGSGVSLTFNNLGTTTITATNNLGGVFQLNSLTLNAYASTMSLSGATGNSLSFVGANASIFKEGGNTSTINSTLPIALTNGLTVAGSGTGGVTFSSIISGTGPLTINQGGALYDGNGAVVALSAANTFTGGVVLQNGHLSVTNATGLGTGTLTIQSGNNTLRTGAITIANNIDLQGDLNYDSTSAGTFTGVISGSGNANFATSATLRGVNTYTGATNIGFQPDLVATTTNLTINTGGTLLNTSAINIGNGAELSIANSSTAGQNIGNRISDTAAINSNGGMIGYTAATGQTTSETFGNLNVTGTTGIRVSNSSTAGTNIQLTFGNLNRTDNATLGLLLSATTATIGGAAGTTNNSNIHFANGASLPVSAVSGSSGTGVFTGVIAFMASAFGSTTGLYNGLVTYDSTNGLVAIRNTNATFFNQVAAAGTLLADANNNLAGATATLTGNTLINSLSNSVTTTLTGTGSSILTVDSGAVVADLTMNLNDLVLNFGTKTGYLHMGADIVLNAGASITGSGGLVVSGMSAGSDLILTNSGANSFTGGLFVHGATGVLFSNDNQLGAAGGNIVLNGGVLSYTGTAEGALDSSRSIRIGGSGGELNVSSTTGTLTVNNNITGSGNLDINGSGNVVMGGTLSHSGNTRFGTVTDFSGSITGGGRVIIDDAVTLRAGANLGSSQIVLDSGDLIFSENQTRSNNFLIASASGDFDVQEGVEVTLSGNINGDEDLTKLGLGTLTVTGAGSLQDDLLVSAGTLRLAGNGSFLNSPNVTVSSGASLVLDNTATTTARLAGDARVSLSGGEFRIDGGNGNLTQNLRALNVTAAGSALTLVPATGALTVNLGSYTLSTGANVIFRGSNLGTAGGARVFINGQAAGFMVNALVDATPTGLGQALAFYDLANGVRFAQASDYTTGTVIQNAAPTSTPLDANFRILTAGNTVDAANTISSLALASGATLNASSGVLNLSSGVVQTEAGAAAAAINGGTLSTTGNFLFFTNSDLTISSTLTGTSTTVLNKSGAGTLTLTGTGSTLGSLRVNDGTLVLGNNAENIFTGVAGTGNLVLGGTSTLRINSGTATVSTNVSGAGGIFYDSTATTTTGSTLTLSGNNTFAGGVTGDEFARFELRSANALGTGALTLANTVASTSTSGTTMLRFDAGNVTIGNNINLSSEAVHSIFNTDQSNQTTILTGKLSGGTTGATLEFEGTTTGVVSLQNAANDFTAKIRVDSGYLGFTSNAALGNAANTIEMQTATGGVSTNEGLRFDANNINLSRDILFTGTGASGGTDGAINTQGFTSTISGRILGAGGGSQLVKRGSGTLILTNTDNQFSGFYEIAEGTLAVDGNAVGLDFPSVTNINNGGTLSGFGAFRDGELRNGGRLSPGRDGTIGTLTAATGPFTAIGLEPRFTWIGGGVMDFDLAAGGTSDLLALQGGFLKGTGTTFAFNFDGSVNVGDTYTLVSFANTTFSLSDFSFTSSISGLEGSFILNGNNLQFTATAVPEPGTMIALGAGALALLRRRRKQS